MPTNCIWFIVLQLSTIKLCKSARTCNDKDLFRTSVYDARPFWYGLLRINIFRVRFWEGGHKKEYAVYANENDDNYGRPLTKMCVYSRKCWEYRNYSRGGGCDTVSCTTLRGDDRVAIRMGVVVGVGKLCGTFGCEVCKQIFQTWRYVRETVFAYDKRFPFLPPLVLWHFHHTAAKVFCTKKPPNSA